MEEITANNKSIMFFSYSQFYVIDNIEKDQLEKKYEI